MKRRILTITPFLWSGAGKAIVNLLGRLQDLGVHNEIISSGKSRGFSDWPSYVDILNKREIPYHQIDFFDRDPACTWNGINRLADFLRSNRFDLVHVHGGVPAFAAIAARDRTKGSFPVLATLHSWNPERPAWMNHADIWALNRCDCVVTVSFSYRRYLGTWGLDDRKARTIYWGIDPASLPASGRERSNGSGFRVLSVGRIEPRKDQETLLKAFHGFHKTCPKSALNIAGPVADRTYFNRLRRRACRYHWDQGVKFHGTVRDLNGMFANSDVFVAASLNEGLGLSLLEAMSHGLPTICTRIDGHTDFAIDGENACIVPSGNARAISESLRALWSDAALRERLGRNACRMVRRTFSWCRTVREYMKIYRSLW